MIKVLDVKEYAVYAEKIKNNCYQYLNDIKDTKNDGNETEEENNVLSEQEIKTVKKD